MKRRIVPPLVLVAVTMATFGLAKWHPFSPAPAPAAGQAGDAERGRQVFVVNCAGCHGTDAEGGIGPSLVGSGLSADDVRSVVAEGRGVMPSGLVGGRDAADVAAYVATVAK